MNELIIDNHVILKDIKGILSKLRFDNNDNKLKNIIFSSDEVRVSCPFHKEGLENRPSCNIYIGDSDNLAWGTFHCFTCNTKGSIVSFIAGVLNISQNKAKKWLLDNFTAYEIPSASLLTIDSKIDLTKKIADKKYISESILDNFQSWHPYMQKRKLSKDICLEFNVKYDPKTECIVFPVRDLSGNIVFLTRRNVNKKQFIIDANAEKEVYLLYDIVNNKTKQVFVVESQINALTLRSWGYPAIALMGTGTKYQYDLLKKANILEYILCFDGDEAGRNGAIRFKNNLSNSIIYNIDIPQNKDVNDLNKDEFDKLLLNKHEI